MNQNPLDSVDFKGVAEMPPLLVLSLLFDYKLIIIGDGELKEKKEVFKL